VTFKQIVDDACLRIGNEQPEARVRFRSFANEWCNRILTECLLPTGASTTLAVVAGTEQYTLAAAVSRIQTLYDPTHNHALTERSLSSIRQTDPNASQSGQPVHFAYVTDRIIELWPSPSDDNTLNLDYEAVFTDMDEDVDVPIIPEKFHYLITLGIRLNEYEKNSDKRLSGTERNMQIGISKLRHWLASRRTNVPNPGKTISPTSRLGGWYPAGS
jgi:hypothetical protein